jgi:hypothetical protein
MKRRAFMSSLASLGVAVAAAPRTCFALDYDKYIPLDAEDLAETGIKAAYEKLRPSLRKYIPQAAAIRELINNDEPSYTVVCQGVRYFIYGGANQDHSWDNATFALFDIVNRQLAKTKVRFFAFNHGNDLGGMFLPPAEAEASKKTLPRKADWPYLPVRETPKAVKK